MSCHRTGVWSPRGSCSARRWRCPYRCGRSRRCSPRMFLQPHRAQGPQGNHSGTKKHHGTQGTVPTHCFSSIQPRTHKQLLNTHVGNIPASATSRLFVGTLQTKILPSGYSICVWNTNPCCLVMNLLLPVSFPMPTVDSGWSPDTSHQWDTWSLSALLNEFS